MLLPAAVESGAKAEEGVLAGVLPKGYAIHMHTLVLPACEARARRSLLRKAQAISDNDALGITSSDIKLDAPCAEAAGFVRC